MMRKLMVKKKDNFVLGANNAVEFKRRQIETVKQRLANKKLETLQMTEPKLASPSYIVDLDIRNRILL